MSSLPRLLTTMRRKKQTTRITKTHFHRKPLFWRVPIASRCDIQFTLYSIYDAPLSFWSPKYCSKGKICRKMNGVHTVHMKYEREHWRGIQLAARDHVYILRRASLTHIDNKHNVFIKYENHILRLTWKHRDVDKVYVCGCRL